MIKDIYKLPTKKVEENSLQKRFDQLEKKITQIEQVNREIHITPNPEIQKVEITNQQPFPENVPTVFPEVQKVEVTNQQEIVVEKVTFPTELDVFVKNPQPPASLELIEKLLATLIEKKYPITKEVTVTNPTIVDIPVGYANDPKSANPSRYVPVRLTDGKRFYTAIADAYVSAAKTVFPFVNMHTGKPQAATVDDDGTLRTDVEISGITVTVSGTTTSGTPGYQFQTNIPTIQTVNVQNAQNLTSISGTNLHTFVDNFPTVQTVRDQSLTISGSQHTLIDNFPTVFSFTGNAITTDGFNIAHILAANGQAGGQNAQLVANAYLDVTYTTTSGLAVATTDVGNYKSVSVHNVTNGTSSVVNFQGSNDNINWVAIPLVDQGSNSTATVTSLNAAGKMYAGNLSFRYFRLNVTGIASGTTAGVVHFSTFSYSPHTMGVINTSSGSGAVVVGGKTNNNAAPGATNIGVLPAVATAQIPAYTEGFQVGLSTDLNGNVRTTMSGVFNPANTFLAPPYSAHITTNTTTTPTAALAYISSITIGIAVGGTTSTVSIQDKSGTPLKLVNALGTITATTTPTVINFQTPIKMVGGIDIVTAGSGAATLDVWINYYQ